MTSALTSTEFGRAAGSAADFPSLVAGTPVDWSGRVAEFTVNPRAGRGRDATITAQRLALALERLGAEIRWAGRAASSEATARAGARPRVIVAVGGDGTVNAAARRAIESGSALLVVPRGTMNLVARDLDLPVRAEALLASLSVLQERRIDVASVNGALFLHSSLLGFVPALARLRERLRGPLEPRAAARECVRFAHALLRTPTLRLELDSDRGKARGLTRSLAVTCNALAEAGLGEHRRTDLEGGRLAVYASAHAGPLGPLRLLAALAAGSAPRDPETDTGRCATLSVRCPRRRLRVSNDGEVGWFDTPLEYRIHPRGLTVLAPAPAL